MLSATSYFADLADVTLHYRRLGRGEPVVLVHGIPQTSYEWRYVMPRLAAKYTVIAPDLRGLGDSTRPPGVYDKKTLGADIAALAITHLGFDRFHLWGTTGGDPSPFRLPPIIRRQSGRFRCSTSSSPATEGTSRRADGDGITPSSARWICRSSFASAARNS